MISYAFVTFRITKNTSQYWNSNQAKKMGPKAVAILIMTEVRIIQALSYDTFTTNTFS